MEKLIFVDKTELSFDAIYVSGSELVITVNNGDFAALETKFSDAANLEKLIQTDADGHKMAAFRNYAILKSITKRKNVIIDEIEETKADIIDVALEKEPEWVVSQRYQDHRIKAAEDTVEKLVSKIFLEILGKKVGLKRYIHIGLDGRLLQIFFGRACRWRR